MKSLGDFKRGDTFSFYAILTDHATGLPLDVEATALRCQLRDSKYALVAELLVVKTEAPGTYLFSLSASLTSEFPLGVLKLDIELTDGEIVTSSETFTVNVIKDVTRYG